MSQNSLFDTQNQKKNSVGLSRAIALSVSSLIYDELIVLQLVGQVEQLISLNFFFDSSDKKSDKKKNSCLVPGPSPVVLDLENNRVFIGYHVAWFDSKTKLC